MSHDNDDITFEEEQEDEGRARLKGKSEKKLREELKKTQQERHEYLEGWQRAKADLVNFKREVETERSRATTYAIQDLLHDLLPVMDSFEMAFKDKERWERADEGWRKGVEYIYAQLLSILENREVKQINPLGESFDPTQHDSIEVVAVDEKEDDGTVVDVIQRGYMLGERLIRAPKVRVGAYKS